MNSSIHFATELFHVCSDFHDFSGVTKIKLGEIKINFEDKFDYYSWRSHDSSEGGSQSKNLEVLL